MMLNTNTINLRIQKNILNGIKTPHSTSYPVIYCENNKYYLVCFVFFYTREDIDTGKIDRPTVWTIADIKTGEIIREYETKEKEFSDAPYDVKYNVCPNTQYDTSKEYYDDTFAILDSVREEFLKTGQINLEKYKEYMKKILVNIPDSYKRFYLDLSIQF